VKHIESIPQFFLVAHLGRTGLRRRARRFCVAWPFWFCALALLAVSHPVRGQQQPPPKIVAATPAAQPAPGAPPAVLTIVDADNLYRTGKFDEAVKAYGALIASGTEPALSYVGLARVYLSEQDPKDAYNAVAKAVALSPTYPAVRTALGEAYFRQGKLVEAQKEFLALVRGGSSYARAYLGMARISRAASAYKQSKQMIDKAHELDPGDPDIRKFWLETLPLAERMKALNAYLSGETNDDVQERVDLEQQLAILRDKEGRPLRACRLAAPATSMKTDLKQLLYDPRHLRAYGLAVGLNGVSATLELDTGAGGIIVERKTAEKAGVKRLLETKIGGAGDKGDAAAYVGRVDSFRVGSLEFRDCYVHVVEKRSVLDENGLIGADVFSDFLVDIDLPNGKFSLSELPHPPGELAPSTSLEAPGAGVPEYHDRYIAPEMKSYSTILRFGHLLLIPTKIGDAPPKLFLIDTGAFGNTISPAAAKEVTKISSDYDTEVKGLSGKVKDVFRTGDVTLTFGHLRQRNQDMVAFDTTTLSESAGTEISGILGFTLLRMIDIKIDYRDGLVDFSFDSKRFHE
jgi:tetratricopeptide (TPR) repeat protein/predicted aspartyl protease